jgi:heterotetrameric sarcosine oxidase gamma subunit
MARTENANKFTPLHRLAEKASARFSNRSGWLVAVGYGALEDEVAAARRRVALADNSANGKVLAEGKNVASVLQSAWRAATMEIGQGAAAGPGYVYRLRSDLFFVSTDPGREIEAVEALDSAVQIEGAFVTVTDVTHGRSELKIVGPHSAKLLNRLCGLDFHPEAFPNHAARQSSVAKTSQLIIRSDSVSASGGETVTGFTLIGARSLAAYLWETLLEAGRDLDIAPIGQTALEQLAG